MSRTINHRATKAGRHLKESLKRFYRTKISECIQRTRQRYREQEVSPYVNGKICHCAAPIGAPSEEWERYRQWVQDRIDYLNHERKIVNERGYANHRS